MLFYAYTCIVKPILSSHSKRRQNNYFQDRLSLNAGQTHSAILSTFIRLPLVFKTFVLSIVEWPLKTGFTVPNSNKCRLLIIFRNSFDPELAKKMWALILVQTVCHPDGIILNEFFDIINFKNIQQRKKIINNFPSCKELIYL